MIAYVVVVELPDDEDTDVEAAAYMRAIVRLPDSRVDVYKADDGDDAERVRDVCRREPGQSSIALEAHETGFQECLDLISDPYIVAEVNAQRKATP